MIAGSGWATWLLDGACCGGFLALAYWAARACGRSAAPEGGRPRTLALILLAGFAGRIVLAAITKGHPTDIGTFGAWAGDAAKGLTDFYSPGYFADYPPGYIYVLWLIGKLRLMLHVNVDTPAYFVLLKMPAILADLVTAWLIWRLARRCGCRAPGLLAALYLFNPAVFINSAAWGQVDSVLTVLCLLGMLLLERSPAGSAASFAAALLVKPQALIFGPVVVLWHIDRLVRRRDRKAVIDLLVFLSAGAAVFALGVLPFELHHGWGWVVGKYSATLASYPYATFNAFNLFALLGGNGLANTETFLCVPYAAWSIGLIALVLMFCAVVALGSKDPTRFWFIAMFLPASAFVLSTKMHERYLFPALAMSLALVIVNRDWRGLAAVLFAGLSITQFLNQSEVLSLSLIDIYLVDADDPEMLMISLANVLLWMLAAWIGYRRYVATQVTPAAEPAAEPAIAPAIMSRRQRREAAKKKPVPTPAPQPVVRRWHLIALACILLATTGLRLYRLQVPDHYYFDEVYFGYAAKQCLAGDRKIYDAWPTNVPAGVYTAWDHPPMGKLVIAGTMALAGTEPFGMRLSSALMGGAAVALVFLLTVTLFRSPRAGLLAAGLYSLDGLAFAQSRIATVDSHLVAFLLAALCCYAYWRKTPGRSLWWLVAAGGSAGLMLATKWTGLYLLAILGTDFLISWVFRLRRYSLQTVAVAFLCLAVLPLAVYVAAYTQYFYMGHGWGDFINLQQQTWKYHTGEIRKHRYQSEPWQWMLNLKPVYLYVDSGPADQTPQMIAQIYNLGNSVVFYFGLLAVAAVALAWTWRRTWPAAFLLAAYLMMWVPWSLSPRLMFFYHYLPAVPLLCVASGLVLARLLDSRRPAVRLAAWAVVTLAIAWFVFFFPHITGIPEPRAWADAAYYWTDAWR